MLPVIEDVWPWDQQTHEQNKLDQLTIPVAPEQQDRAALKSSTASSILLRVNHGWKRNICLSLSYSPEDAPYLTEEGQKSGDLPTNKRRALKGSEVITHPSLTPSSKAHWRTKRDTHFSAPETQKEVQLGLPGRWVGLCVYVCVWMHVRERETERGGGQYGSSSLFHMLTALGWHQYNPSTVPCWLPTLTF